MIKITATVWPKARHHKRRLVQQEFLGILQKTLCSGGEFLFKTDHPEYFEWILEEIEEFNAANPKKTISPLPWPENDEDGSLFYPKTDFQRLWEDKGRKIDRLRLNNP